MEPIEQSIDRYLAAMDTADRTQSEVAQAKTVRLKDKIEKLTQQMHGLKEMEQRLRDAPDGQVSLTDPEARSMATSGRGTGIVGYNVQTAVRVGEIKAILRPGRGRRAPTVGWLAPRELRVAHRGSPSRASHQLRSCAGDRGAVKTRPADASCRGRVQPRDWDGLLMRGGGSAQGGRRRGRPRALFTS